MVDFVKKRLQVFVSSTFTDLKNERQAAVEAILTAGHFPAGMELFTSGDESQMEVIKQWIDESDVYMLILGGRYGSIEPKSGKSYTRLEYEYALEKGKPLFACVVNESSQNARVQKFGISVIEMENPSGLNEFRTEVQTRLVKYWDDHKDIKIAVSETLAQFSRRDDLVGWVRPQSNSVDMGALAEEISRLSHENAQLRKQIVDKDDSPRILGFSFEELYLLLERENLIDHCRNIHRVLFNEGRRHFNIQHSQSSQQLVQLGLIEFIGTMRYIPTEEGRIFLNRLYFNDIQKSELKPS